MASSFQPHGPYPARPPQGHHLLGPAESKRAEQEYLAHPPQHRHNHSQPFQQERQQMKRRQPRPLSPPVAPPMSASTLSVPLPPKPELRKHPWWRERNRQLL
ncbi:unnamed protein product [Ectocarpus sp. 6 AP-2014]